MSLPRSSFRARVEFRPADLDDARITARELLERVMVSDELLAQLVKESGGSMRRIVAGLAQIEKFAVRKRLTEVSNADFNRGEMVAA